MKEYVIGLDIGTTCTKALIVDETGAVAGEDSQGYRLISNGRRIEQRPEDWIEAAGLAVRKAVQKLDLSQIAGISLSTQGASTAAVDKNGRPIGNALTWMDGRADAEALEIERELGGEYIYHTSGWRINPSLDAAKIRYMKKDPTYAGAAGYYTTLEILNDWLTGNAVIDPTNAAIRQLYNVAENRWDARLLSAAGITQTELPKVLPTGAVVGKLTAQAAAEMGIYPGIPVFNGAHDQYCASIGAGAVHDGDMLLSAGTTWVLMGISHKPLFTESFIAPGRHPVEGLYGAIASLVCSGASLQWFKNEFLTENFDEIDRVAAQRRDRTADLCFYPYQAGANYPIWNLKARGAFTGVTLDHDRFDFARAIMEGVAFGVRRAAADFAVNGTDIQKIIMMGGAARSPFWCQMITDVTNVSLEKLSQTDVCALGAAAIALRGAGLYPSYEAASSAMVHSAGTCRPNPENVDWYTEKFQKFDRMWQCMQRYYKT